MEYNTDWKAIQQRFLPCKSKHRGLHIFRSIVGSLKNENLLLTAEETERIQKIALGTQKSYKQDAAEKKKRGISEAKIRSKTAYLANWKPAFHKENKSFVNHGPVVDPKQSSSNEKANDLDSEIHLSSNSAKETSEGGRDNEPWSTLSELKSGRRIETCKIVQEDYTGHSTATLSGSSCFFNTEETQEAYLPNKYKFGTQTAAESGGTNTNLEQPPKMADAIKIKWSSLD
ncbi:hypothetical protein NC651_010016 [Populus alba x Populus x berolinensis]|nr:hypothetical protein NC651_010016 [Populus alba x Populus x berolinensis]